MSRSKGTFLDVNCIRGVMVPKTLQMVVMVSGLLIPVLLVIYHLLFKGKFIGVRMMDTGITGNSLYVI